MRAAVVQVPSVSEGVLDLVAPHIGQAAVDGARLIVLPEGVMHDFRPRVDLASIAEPLDGEFVAGLSDQARRLSLWILAGMWEKV
ncbi:MAG: hypothetical protein OEW91_04130, partial [Acidimicrobiia bacterium]|nr:hypothetical protein [Acidimicrobiia bacterium]